MLAFDWLEQTDKIGYNIFPTRMTCAELSPIFVPFHFYLVMTLVVPCLDNIFMVLLISELAIIGVMKPILLDSGAPRGVRGHALL